MTVTIEPGSAFGTVTVPPSKSYAHRFLIASCLAGKDAVIENYGTGEDLSATEDCLRALGADFSQSASCITVHQRLRACPDRNENASRILPECPCRESGSTLRFILPLALVYRNGAVFTGSRRLMERGVEIYRTLLESRGIRFDCTASNITVQGTLRNGNYRIPGNISSQYITGLLFSLPLLEGESILEVLPPMESASYISLTLDTLRTFGITIDILSDCKFRIPGRQVYVPGRHNLEGDWSNAAYFFALQQRSENLTILGLNENSCQGDRICTVLLDRLKEQGTETEIDLSEFPDLGPVLFAAAAAGRGGVFTGIRRLRLKESDRAGAMAEELNKFSVRTIVEENRMTVLPGEMRRPNSTLYSHNDHRITMALAFLCTVTGGTITRAEAVRKSYPDFFNDLKSLGIDMH